MILSEAFERFVEESLIGALAQRRDRVVFPETAT